MNKKRVVFITGTRADFGKLKSLLVEMSLTTNFECHLFITGMHLLSKYGSTYYEIEKCLQRVNLFKYINQNHDDTMDVVLAKTVSGFSDYVKETKPDMIVVHGDRVEAMAGAIVGSLNNILVSHIEGGEVSGTIDELIRHSISKLSHLHFVANVDAKQRLIRMGEREGSIYVVGSPDIDIMLSGKLPTISEVKAYYDIPFARYAVGILHPVTTEVEKMSEYAKIYVDALCASDENFVLIYPNNDLGTQHILEQIEPLQNNDKFVVHSSMRFEYFLTLLKYANFIIGNSSSGVREAPVFGVPAINIGERQYCRSADPMIMDVPFDYKEMVVAIKSAPNIEPIPSNYFGSGNSSHLFLQTLLLEDIWRTSSQKYFVDDCVTTAFN